MTFLLDETDCSGEFLRYFARLHVTCNHMYVIRNPVTLGCRYMVTVNVLTKEKIVIDCKIMKLKSNLGFC